jgi:hypothetical protein
MSDSDSTDSSHGFVTRRGRTSGFEPVSPLLDIPLTTRFMTELKEETQLPIHQRPRSSIYGNLRTKSGTGLSSSPARRRPPSPENHPTYGSIGRTIPVRFADTPPQVSEPAQPDILNKPTPKEREVNDEATALNDSLVALGISRNTINVLIANYEIDLVPMNICMTEAEDLRSLAIPMLEVKKIINLSQFYLHHEFTPPPDMNVIQLMKSVQKINQPDFSSPLPPRTPVQSIHAGAGEIATALTPEIMTIREAKTESIPKFTGQWRDWRKWFESTKAVLGMNGWMSIANSKTKPTTRAELQANNTMYYQLLKATTDSQVYGLVHQYLPSPDATGTDMLADGRLAWQALIEEFTNPENTAAMRTAVEAELLALRCTEKDSIIQYIDAFNKLYRELIALGHAYDPDTLFHHFTDRIQGKRYELDLAIGIRKGWSLQQMQKALRRSDLHETRKEENLKAYNMRMAKATPKASTVQKVKDSEKPAASTNQKEKAGTKQAPKADSSANNTNGDVTYKNGFKVSQAQVSAIPKATRNKIKGAADKKSAVKIFKEWKKSQSAATDSSDKTKTTSNSNNSTASDSNANTDANSNGSVTPNWQQARQRRFRVKFAPDVKDGQPLNKVPQVKVLEEPKTVGGYSLLFTFQ